MKFSDLYIDTKIIKQKRIIDNDVEIIEYEERKIIKELIPNNKNLYYVWGRIADVMNNDFKCRKNNNIMKIKDLCLHIEKSIKRGDFDIVILDIKNVLLPLLDKLTIEEINIIKTENRISAGPLYDSQPYFSTPEIFVNLFLY
jgi:hypothetical protein